MAKTFFVIMDTILNWSTHCN